MSKYTDITAGFHQGNLFSREANVSIAGSKAALRARIYRHIEGSPLGVTCDEIEQELGLSHQTASARMTELKALGAVEAVGQRKTRSGRNAAVYEAKNGSLGKWE